MVTVVLWAFLLTFTSPGQQRQDRYFKEDHLTGADYIRLAADDTYVLTGREHMGIWLSRLAGGNAPVTRSSSFQRRRRRSG